MLPNESVEGGARYLNNLIDKYSQFDEGNKNKSCISIIQCWPKSYQ